MPRVSRQQSESGFYHVILRGNGKQLLFEDDADRLHFLELLSEKTTSDGIAVIAWCLMSNHVHLLLDDPDNLLSHAMHALCTAYARAFNEKSGHAGAVFQGRFTSIPIASDRQLLQAVRYIHENPAKAGVASVGDYRWSSYGDYLRESGIADTSRVLSMVGGHEGFLGFCADGRFGAYYPRASKRVPDEDAVQAAVFALDGMEPGHVKELPKGRRDDTLRVLRAAGITVKQIERLTGIGHNTISRVTT